MSTIQSGRQDTFLKLPATFSEFSPKQRYRKGAIMHSFVLSGFRVCLAGVVALFLTSVLPADDEFERAPILYSESTPQNRVSDVQAQIDRDELHLEYSPEFGYLPSLLKALKVPVESQSLVFSKTSLQMRRISPRTPRAIYFSDDVYVGFCQSGEVLEISAVDPQLGAVFYSLDQRQMDRPQIVRRTDNCLVCHSSSRVEGVPGHVIRSLYVDSSGQPLLSGGSRTVDHTTPIDQRWGGWYVTGTHGAQKHLGNLTVKGRDFVEPVDNSDGHNLVDLEFRINPDRYLTAHSDIVALMVLEHQALVHNRLTRANFDTRQALAYKATINEAMDEPVGSELESTTRRIKSTGDRLVQALLFTDEAPLTAPIKGTSGYAEQFTSSGPRDKQGRSLRDLDMTTRMFRYPCSYLIYSKSFDELPAQSRDYVLQKLWDVLTGKDTSKEFSHLSPTDRQAILEILCETKPHLPSYWKL
jgi:hypothetical protein